MVETNYDTQAAADTFLDYAQSVGADIQDNSFTRKPYPDETVHSITAAIGTSARPDDIPYLSIYFKPDVPRVSVVGFNFEGSSVDEQLDFCRLVLQSLVTFRRYEKTRLGFLKSKLIYELTLDHNGNKLVLTRWDAEIKTGQKTRDALKLLTGSNFKA